MSDFIEFLNQADAEALSKLADLTPVQVESILAARPFSSLEDCSRISSLTKKKLTQLKSSWQKSQVSETEKSVVEVEEAVEQPEIIEPEQQPEKPKKNTWVGKLITIVVILLLLAGAGYAFIKWGVPFLYEKYVKPVEANTANITDLAVAQDAEVARLDAEIATLQERASTLEARADAVDEALASHDESLANLEEMQNTLETALAAQKSDLLLELDNQVKFTRTLELISRSRLYLSQSNYGLAQADLESSRKLLYTMLESIPADQQDAMRVVIERIDMALRNLPAYPVVAVYDVDTAWQLLVDGLPNVPEQAVTPIVLPEETTPEPTEEAVTPTATP